MLNSVDKERWSLFIFLAGSFQAMAVIRRSDNRDAAGKFEIKFASWKVWSKRHHRSFFFSCQAG
jgi:hypothetical protein